MDGDKPQIAVQIMKFRMQENTVAWSVLVSANTEIYWSLLLFFLAHCGQVGSIKEIETGLFTQT